MHGFNVRAILLTIPFCQCFVEAHGLVPRPLDRMPSAVEVALRIFSSTERVFVASEVCAFAAIFDAPSTAGAASAEACDFSSRTGWRKTLC